MYLSAHGKNEKVAHKHAGLPIPRDSGAGRIHRGGLLKFLLVMLYPKSR